MEPEEARQLLGLGNDPLTIAALRAARNSALKAHHPDVVGSDAAAKRRATYWSVQINTAYETLAAELGAESKHTRQSEPEPERQSFAAAARRASERAAAEARATEAKAAQAREQAAAAARLAQAQAEERAAAEAAAREARVRDSEQRAAQAHAERQARLASKGPPVVAAGTAASRLRSKPAILGGGIFVVVLAVAVIAGSGLLQPATAAVSPTSALTVSPLVVRPTLRATPRPTVMPRPTDTPARGSFDFWLSMDQRDVAPCFSGGPCNTLDTVRYDDGTSKKLATAIDDLVDLYHDNFVLGFDNKDMCAEEMGSTFAQIAALAASIDLADRLKTGETVAGEWRPVTVVQFERCGIAPEPSDGGLTAIRVSLAAAAKKLEDVRASLGAKDWSAARRAGQELAWIGTELARVSARDLSTTAPWADARDASVELLRMSGTLQVQRLAAAPATLSKLDALHDALKRLLDNLK